MIEVGQIYLIKADESNDITPKGGMAYRPKYFVVMGIDEEGNIYGGVVFDSEINPNHVSPMMMEFFMPIASSEYSFLTHDSFLDCSKLKPAVAEKLLEGQYMGNLKPVHMTEAKRLICMSPRESFVHLRKYGLK